MPIVTVNMMEGRSQEKIAQVIAAMSEAISASLEAEINSVRIIVNEVQPHQFGVAGKTFDTVLDERAAAASSLEP
jgi:4-oxalocrotonate tautomerase